MFCKNCGKDIGEARFCQFCGTPSDESNNITVNVVQNDFIKTLGEKIAQIGQEKLITLIAIISTIINIIIRIANNEIVTVYSLLAQDDYFVISNTGRTYMLLVIVIQIITHILLYNNAKKNQSIVSKKSIALAIILIAIQVFAMLLKLPAA